MHVAQAGRIQGPKPEWPSWPPRRLRVGDNSGCYAKKTSAKSAMKRPVTILTLLALAVIAGLVLFLGFWDMAPAPTRVERVIPNERLPR